MNKKQIINDILVYLEKELAATVTAANNAHLAATDDQSVAETQYDTLAIEASYLAEGQSRRVQEIQQAQKALELFSPRNQQENMPITLGTLVQIAQDKIKQHWFFIAPAAGGFRGTLEDQNYTVLTPNSPMAKALIGKLIDDEIELMIGARKLRDEIIGIY
jgi:transcription elongation GreA/GreB family factor